MHEMSRLKKTMATADVPSVECEVWIRKSIEEVLKLHQTEAKGVEAVEAAKPYYDVEFSLQTIPDIQTMNFL